MKAPKKDKQPAPEAGLPKDGRKGGAKDREEDALAEERKLTKEVHSKEKSQTKTSAGSRVTLDIGRSFMSIIINRLDIPNIKTYLDKAGLDIDIARTSKKIRNIALAINFFLSIYLISRLFLVKPNVMKGVIYVIVIVVFGFIAVIMAAWLAFYLYLDFRVRKSGGTIRPQGTTAGGKESAKPASEKRRLFMDLIEKAGLTINLQAVSLFLFRLAVVSNLAINIYLFYFFSDIKPGILFTILWTTLLWTIFFILIILLLWVAFFVFIDLRIYQRKKEIEDVLPDFLQLTAANISSGMTIDRALWFAVRPRFGVLAKEIEDVAKSTLVGENLKDALLKFSNKYDSMTLQRSINLLIEGMESGGDIGPLLNKIASNIQDTKILKKEMSANVTTYVIFITFASILAAPFLFALSTELIIIMQSILGQVAIGDGGGAASGLLSIDASGIKIGDFKIFVYLSMLVTSTFSAIIVSIIKKGNIKDGLQYIPLFIIVSFIMYTGAYTALDLLLGGMF